MKCNNKSIRDTALYCVYILENNPKTLLFVGVTTNLQQTIRERKQGENHVVDCSNLVYYEFVDSKELASERENVIKSMTRKERKKLIQSLNPEEKDLFTEI